MNVGSDDSCRRGTVCHNLKPGFNKHVCFTAQPAKLIWPHYICLLRNNIKCKGKHCSHVYRLKIIELTSHKERISTFQLPDLVSS
jgi:hypothetical protein